MGTELLLDVKHRHPTLVAASKLQVGRRKMKLTGLLHIPTFLASVLAYGPYLKQHLPTTSQRTKNCGSVDDIYLQTLYLQKDDVYKTGRMKIHSMRSKSGILGGGEVVEGAFPWQVSVGGVGRCGGSLISEEWVLTAAHCLGHADLGWDKKDVILLSGLKVKTKFMVIHEDYGAKGQELQNDIALLKLSKRLKFGDKVKAVCLAERDNLELAKYRGSPARGNRKIIRLTANVPGWGNTSLDGSGSKTLQQVTVPISPCDRLYNKSPVSYKINYDKLICAREKRSWCDGGRFFGTSGGPMIVEIGEDPPRKMRVPKNMSKKKFPTKRRNKFQTQLGRKASGSKYYQIGIVSKGVACGGYPGIFTRVDYYIDWIDRIMSKGDAELTVLTRKYR